MKPPKSFFRIILPSVMRDYKLMIPEGFAKVHSSELSTTVALTVPGGQVWDIGLELSGKELWFHDGWKEFAEYHSIGCWFFILFKYEGNSKFNVHIFDVTAAEISYPINNRRQNTVPDQGDEEGDNSVEILSSLGAEQSDVPSEHECVKKKATGDNCSELDDEEEITMYEDVTASPIGKQRAYEMPDPETLLDKPQKKRDNSKNLASTTQREDEQLPTVKIQEELECSISKLTKSQLVTTPGGKNAISEAMTSNKENPSFKVVLRPYNIRKIKLLHVPLQFVRDYLNISSSATVILTSGGRQWKVLLIYTERSHCLSRGWPTFVKENHLSVGNVCVFELIKVKDITFKVSILRGGEVLDNPVGERCSAPFLQNISEFAHEFSRNKRRKLDNGEETADFENVTATLQGKQRAYEMPNVARLLLDKSEKKKKMDESKNVENLKAGTRVTRKNSISKSCLAEGRVHVESTTRKEDKLQLTVKNKEVELPVPKVIKSHLATINEASAFKPVNPYFTVVLQPYNIIKGSYVNVSTKFIRDHLKISSQATALLTFGGRQWKVLLVNYTHRLCRGWSTFVKDNQLSVGNKCVFELIEAKKVTFKVSIFRGSDESKNVENIEAGSEAICLDNPTEREGTQGQHQTASLLCLEATTHNEDEQKPTVKNEQEVVMSVQKVIKSQLVRTRGKSKAIREAMMYKPENPSFMVFLQHYNVKRGLLNVPVTFISEHLKISSMATILLTVGGRQWEVVLYHVNKTHCLRRGWSTFVEDNQLSEGDVCVFELVDAEKIVFKVSVFRAG